MTDAFFMKKALQEAVQARDASEVPVGAVIVVGEIVIARGFNQVELLRDCTAHAEMLALTSAFAHVGSKYLPDATLYVTLEPCLMCSGALFWSKIGRVVYGASDERNGLHLYGKGDNRQSGNLLHPKTVLTRGVLEAECAQLIKDFFRERR